MKRLLSILAVSLGVSGAEAPREGLILHLDASAQRTAREELKLPAIGHLQPVDFLLDGSTHKRMAQQVSPASRPIFVTDRQSSFLKFDGIDDFLALEARKESVGALTLFVLAAPRTNAGGFSAMFGAAEMGRNDYTSGINFDFGPGPTTNISVVNVESAGAGGFRDLLTPGFFNAAERPFGGFHVFTVRSAAGTNTQEVFLDGFKGGDRPRGESRISLEQAAMGARFYSNDPNQPPFAQGFFAGAIAEVLLYDRALSDADRSAVEQALLAKTVGLNALLRGARGHALETVENPPVVQMFVPGFEVHELPLRIGNLNNVRYRHDGKLVGQGYDGRIYLLSDTDGDGLEDKAEFFWDQAPLRAPIGIALTGKEDPRGDGVFVASRGKVSLILDRDRDGRADEEIVIASGWPEPFHSVDTLGLAVDPEDGSIYFGFGCANFVDAYLIDPATGRSKYRLDDYRGTIQRVSADFSVRETICTGVRFTCGLAFNHLGDLFATDQEGATWLPNGNPLDELLHIQRGRHYGFPPRHPKHLPDVRDEPAVVEYGPQHQSTVGLFFNEEVNGGPHFGPEHWRHDALICGEARGKLYRTKLAKTAHGYVGQNHLIASLTMLAVDACVSPTGDLVVACHSGPPDWGTGPTGEGRIFKVRYVKPELPQPVLAWAAASDEFRVAFDRELDPADWANARERVRIEAGEFVAAGDRFEAIRPGYQIVRDQMATPRRWVEVLALSLTEDRRAIVLHVPRQTEAVSYAVSLPIPEKWRVSGGVPQHPWIDVALTLDGILATTTNQERQTVLPVASFQAAAELTRGSVEHERFFKAAREGAKVTLRGRANLANPYVPAVQPGAKLDWDPSTDLVASRRFWVETDSGGRRYDEPDFEMEVGADSAKDGLYLTDGAVRHPLSPGRVRLPWAVESGREDKVVAKAREDVKGNWLRGRRVFFGDGGCATCHSVRGEGIAFGPDLSNLVHRDRASVLQDILRPSATINPDHIGSLVALRDGTEHTGKIMALNNERVVLGMAGGALVDLPRGTVGSVEPLKGSLMPAGLDQVLTPEQIEDLLTFLLVQPLEPAPIVRTDPLVPRPRRMNEVVQVLGGNPRAVPSERALQILLCGGPKDHGPGEHDYPLWLERWSQLLRLSEQVVVSTAAGFPSAEQLAECDVAVFYNANPGWDAEKAALLDQFHERGGGAVYIHYAVDGGKEPASAAERIGLAFTFGSRFRHGEFDLVFTQPDHPITRGFPTLRFTDETYWNMRGDVSRLNVLGTAVEDGAPRPELWTLERGRSRIVGCIPGHYTWTFDDPLFRILVFRAMCWAAKVDEIDLLAELSTVGARVTNEPWD